MAWIYVEGRKGTIIWLMRRYFLFSSSQAARLLSLIVSFSDFHHLIRSRFHEIDLRDEL